MRSGEEHCGVLSDLCALLFTTLRSPLISKPFTSTDLQPPRVPAACGRLPPISTSGIVYMMLGISLTLMFCGSVTFVIGFMMMPWVLSMVMLLYFFGIVSTIFGLFKAAILSPVSSPLR